ncbi:MAG: hypothetical protein MR601_01335 [Erysipelotrichaceae bacterium]|nr:hypothetical protein [Erysipelotrichaceae bacterium]
MNFNEFRKKYQVFNFNGYDIYEDEKNIEITYYFEIEGLSKFYPKWTIKKNTNKCFKELKSFKECVFSLGLVELISYWKLTCSPIVNIFSNSLDEYQIKWWKKLYFYGLGEFFYVNKIKTNMNDFMEIKTFGEKIEGKSDDFKLKGNLIPVGGGKDSFVSLELLKDFFEDNHTYVINNVKSAINASVAAGYSEKLINVQRTLDNNMIKLNKEGFLNGHTPFSALVAFSSIIVAMIYSKKYICLSNEASANESTVLNDEVNHQYSKSYEFESDFNEYVSKYITNEIKYFSLLRPLSEFDITHIFSKLKKYHKVFRSCNVGSKSGVWCNKCAKCLFVYVMLSAFLNDDELYEIFNENLLESEEMYELLKELSGLKENKPFECVGTRSEVNSAILKAIKLRGENIPLLYKKYLKETSYVEVYDEQYFNSENFVPDKYIEIIKNKLKELKNA